MSESADTTTIVKKKFSKIKGAADTVIEIKVKGEDGAITNFSAEIADTKDAPELVQKEADTTYESKIEAEDTLQMIKQALGKKKKGTKKGKKKDVVAVNGV